MTSEAEKMKRRLWDTHFPSGTLVPASPWMREQIANALYIATERAAGVVEREICEECAQLHSGLHRSPTCQRHSCQRYAKLAAAIRKGAE